MDDFQLQIHRILNDDDAIRGTVDDMINERMPGTEGRTREELEAIVREVHEEAVALFRENKLTANDAPRWEFMRYAERLRKSAT